MLLSALPTTDMTPPMMLRLREATGPMIGKLTKGCIALHSADTARPRISWIRPVTNAAGSCPAVSLLEQLDGLRRFHAERTIGDQSRGGGEQCVQLGLNR
jgi:hypothetical protein